ncbi:MAG: MBL fold metallo-hydrolase [Verrucomicrobiales bacterium]|nr:MBL fold metallo-hydrolase [Verrucomicrobiales bacterium]
MIPIEDFFEDILGKAMRGLSYTPDSLAQVTAVPIQTIQQLLQGQYDTRNPEHEAALRSLTEPLSLDPDKLVTSAKKEWLPKNADVEGLRQYNTPWHDMRVNAFLVWDPKTLIAAAFDTGTDASQILDTTNELGLNLQSIFITHTHGDHIADLPTLIHGASPAVSIYANRLECPAEASPFDEGTHFAIGNLSLRTFTTSGHSIGGTTYFIEGLEQPVAIVGDAMFAGSMGGGQISYAQALDNNRKKILTLPEPTLLCPGHGPISTIAEEKSHNPFFPEF